MKCAFCSYDKEIKAEVNWDKEFVACGEDTISKEKMKKRTVEPREAEEGSMEAGHASVLKED